jgi:hypothetical protein
MEQNGEMKKSVTDQIIKQLSVRIEFIHEILRDGSGFADSSDGV